MSQIEHFAIYADDPIALKDFYVGIFGLHVIFEGAGNPPAYFLADDHGMAIEVLGRPAGNAGVNQRWVCHLALWIDDVPAKRAELERLGIVFESETLVDNDELKTAFFTDPGANRSQIVWRKKRLGQRD
jgi:glyoxylase I family protein